MWMIIKAFKHLNSQILFYKILFFVWIIFTGHIS